MTQKEPKNPASEGHESAPLQSLMGLVDRAREVDAIEWTEDVGEDPLEDLRNRIERARRDQQGEGGAALRRLQEKIEAARTLPPPRPFRRGPGDPVQRLRATMRGERLPDGPRDGGADVGSGPGESAPDEGDPKTGSKRMGKALQRSLRKRPLSGEVRAELARRLSLMLDGPEGEALEEIWELLVFGE